MMVANSCLKMTYLFPSTVFESEVVLKPVSLMLKQPFHLHTTLKQRYKQGGNQQSKRQKEEDRTRL